MHIDVSPRYNFGSVAAHPKIIPKLPSSKVTQIVTFLALFRRFLFRTAVGTPIIPEVLSGFPQVPEQRG